MPKQNRQKVQDTKREKKQHTGRIIEEKFKEGRVVPLIKPKNTSQSKAQKAFDEKSLIVLSGSAGCGKTTIACNYAANLWSRGIINTIIITRPYKHLGADYGAVTGSDALKLLPFVYSMIMKLKNDLGVNVLRDSLVLEYSDFIFRDVSGINIIPIEKIQGLSFGSDTLIIADELQNATKSQVKALVTRSEAGCRIIACGDNFQSALPSSDNGLKYLEAVLNKYPHKDAEVIHFTPKDNCRSGIAGHMANIFEMGGVGWDEKE